MIVIAFIHANILNKFISCVQIQLSQLISSHAPKTEVRRLFSKFFTANILFWEYLGVIYVLDLKTNIFCRKKIQLHFPMNKGLTVPK